MQVAFLLFDGLTQLDLTGPLQVLARMPGATTHIVAEQLRPVPSDCGLALMPTCTFDSAPTVDLLCVPGGFGVGAALANDALMDFVIRACASATWVTSVCTGAFVLGAAGALQGRRATTHWAYRDLLPLVGATPVDARVVRDGSILTGGGVTAGIDFAFTLLAEIHGEEQAQAVQLALEYDPAPPLSAGSPAQAPAAILDKTRARYAQRKNEFAEQVSQNMARRHP